MGCLLHALTLAVQQGCKHLLCMVACRSKLHVGTCCCHFVALHSLMPLATVGRSPTNCWQRSLKTRAHSSSTNGTAAPSNELSTRFRSVRLL
jgi:hypothetical protein